VEYQGPWGVTTSAETGRQPRGATTMGPRPCNSTGPETSDAVRILRPGRPRAGIPTGRKQQNASLHRGRRRRGGRTQWAAQGHPPANPTQAGTERPAGRDGRGSPRSQNFIRTTPDPVRTEIPHDFSLLRPEQVGERDLVREHQKTARRETNHGQAWEGKVSQQQYGDGNRRTNRSASATWCGSTGRPLSGKQATAKPGKVRSVRENTTMGIVVQTISR